MLEKDEDEYIISLLVCSHISEFIHYRDMDKDELRDMIDECRDKMMINLVNDLEASAKPEPYILE